ncbi:hypothetical protein ACOMHN_036261 [Nucella lapillus]
MAENRGGGGGGSPADKKLGNTLRLQPVLLLSRRHLSRMDRANDTSSCYDHLLLRRGLGDERFSGTDQSEFFLKSTINRQRGVSRDESKHKTARHVDAKSQVSVYESNALLKDLPLLLRTIPGNVFYLGK